MAIPKIIHYCWLSGEPYPPDIQKCMDSWKKVLPDYEMRLWDRNRFDCNSMKYTQQALERKKYAFVSDVIRLYALYTEGGIYLDSDIMVFRSFDDLLGNRAFSGIESGGRFAAWLMASEKGNPLIKEMLSYYDKKSFVDNDGIMDLTPNTVPTTRILSYHGMRMDRGLQQLDDITIYPENYFCAKNPWTGKITIAEDTYAMHLFAGAWNDTAKEDLNFFGNIADYISDFLKMTSKDFYIFGTGTAGSLALENLRLRGVSPKGFIVSKRNDAFLDFDGIPIYELDEFPEDVSDVVVLIAILPKNQSKIMSIMHDYGFHELYCLGQ